MTKRNRHLLLHILAVGLLTRELYMAVTYRTLMTDIQHPDTGCPDCYAAVSGGVYIGLWGGLGWIGLADRLAAREVTMRMLDGLLVMVWFGLLFLFQRIATNEFQVSFEVGSLAALLTLSIYRGLLLLYYRRYEMAAE